MFTKKEIEWAAKVSNHLMKLSKNCDHERTERAFGKMLPFGDLAYGKALADWHANGKPEAACFSTAEGQKECPAIMEFRKELTEKFGLPILTKEEAKKELAKHQHVKTVKVEGWGIN